MVCSRRYLPVDASQEASIDVCGLGGSVESRVVFGYGEAGNSKQQSEEVRRMGNKQNKKGKFVEAIGLYDRAIAMVPDYAVCRSNEAKAFIGPVCLQEAVMECELTIGLDHCLGTLTKDLLLFFFFDVEQSPSPALSVLVSDLPCC